MGLVRSFGPGVLVALTVTLLSSSHPDAAAAQGSDAEARALYTAGEVAYSEGRYESARDYFQRAFDMSGRALLLFNIGSAAEHLRHDEEALRAFERYLAETPEDAPNRVAVAARIEILRRTIGTTAEATEATETEATETEPTETEATETEPTETEATVGPSHADDGPGAGPWVLVGVGAAVAIAGAVLVGVGFANADTVANAPDGVSWTELSGAYESAPILEGVGFALIGVGAAAAVGGVIWAVTGGGSSDSTTASVWVDQDSAGVLAWGSF